MARTCERDRRAVIMCPEVEFIISSSRIYYILVLPVDSQQAVCAYRNTTVNVLLTSFDHVDSKELLMAEAAERNMSVYLGMPGMPQQDGAQWNVDVALLPSFYEFTRRVLIDYVVRFQNYSSFKGVYQSQELSLGADSPDDLYPGTHPARSMQCRSPSLDSIRCDSMDCSVSRACTTRQGEPRGSCIGSIAIRRCQSVTDQQHGR